MSDEFIQVYQNMLQDLPDEVLRDSTLECLKTCRFFPTIAEIRERSVPFMQKYNLEKRKLLENNERSKCPAHVKWDAEKNFPFCDLEDSQEKCQFAGTGMCGKWDVPR